MKLKRKETFVLAFNKNPRDTSIKPHSPLCANNFPNSTTPEISGRKVDDLAAVDTFFKRDKGPSRDRFICVPKPRPHSISSSHVGSTDAALIIHRPGNKTARTFGRELAECDGMQRTVQSERASVVAGTNAHRSGK